MDNSGFLFVIREKNGYNFWCQIFLRIYSWIHTLFWSPSNLTFYGTWRQVLSLEQIKSKNNEDWGRKSILTRHHRTNACLTGIMLEAWSSRTSTYKSPLHKRLDSSGKRQRYIKKNVKLDQENNKYYIISDMIIKIIVR